MKRLEWLGNGPDRKGERQRVSQEEVQRRKDDSEYSDDEEEFVLKNDQRGRLVETPKRSVIISKLPPDVIDGLRDKIYVPISLHVAKLCLSKERVKFVKETPRANRNLHLSDSKGKVYLHWITRPVDSRLQSDENTLTILRMVSGLVRDQEEHPLCWDFTMCDMTSSTAVLSGQMKEYESLSHLYVCQNVDPVTYGRYLDDEGIVINDDDFEAHRCYEDSLHNALKFAKQGGGIPLASKEENEVPYDCKVRRHLLPDERMFHVKDVYRYDTLDQALERLKTHTVGATLICFKDWAEQGIYSGPKEHE